MVVVVPARGGSKGLPGKNIKSLSGRPLIHYTLEAALEAKNVSRVFVSTDDENIASVSEMIPDVEVPFLRPIALSSDTAAAIDVYLHFVDKLKEQEGIDIQELCVLLPTSPLRLASDIDDAISLFQATNADVVVSVQEAKPLAWHQNIGRDKRLSGIININHQQAIANRQDFGESPVVLNGSIYVLNIPALRKSRSYFGEKTYAYIMPSIRSIDIDDIDDFRHAEALLMFRRKE